jgi:hypothetical protein
LTFNFPHERIEVDLSQLAETDLFGRFYLRKPAAGRFDGYYASLNALRPLLASRQWQGSVTGFYINVAGDFDAVRLSYFTSAAAGVQNIVEFFVAQHGLETVQEAESPITTKVSEGYGGEELRFRRFLAAYTQIGLEIMEGDLLNARCLFAAFRWQVMPARKSYKPHFVPTFKRNSPFYLSLSETDQDQFWSDISHWPNPPQVDWAHLFVNMVLGCDWIGSHFLTPQPPLSIEQINERVKEQNFAIPADWHP